MRGILAFVMKERIKRMTLKEFSEIMKTPKAWECIPPGYNECGFKEFESGIFKPVFAGEGFSYIQEYHITQGSIIEEIQDKDEEEIDAIRFHRPFNINELIGCLGFFWDENPEELILDELQILNSGKLYAKNAGYGYKHFKPLTEQELGKYLYKIQNLRGRYENNI
jgi:hypothetical protein